MKLTSPAFKEGSMIPQQYTCDGENISPQLTWTDAPEEVKSFVLISDDPDAPMGTWVHWVIYNIPADIKELAEDIPPDKQLSNGALQGVNDFRKMGYGGPCPPGGRHRYYFKLYALNTKLNLSPGASKNEIEKAIMGHVLAEAQLMGTYQR